MMLIDKTQRKGNAMNQFIARYQDQLQGVLTGFDRLVFRGNLCLNYESGIKGYLYANGVSWKDYARHVNQVSERVTEAAKRVMLASGRPVEYLFRGDDSKEAKARAIADRDKITEGPICGFTAVEPCWSWRVRGDRASQKLILERARRQCRFVYHYWMDPLLGFMSTRLQTWFPFSLYVYTNGRERLARQMQAAGIAYKQRRNCFPWIQDFARAQSLMQEQLNTNWAEVLNAYAERTHPLFGELSEKYPMSYYWTAFQSEWAMDLVFRDAEQLRRLYPQLIHLSMVSLSTNDVMRFMDKRLSRKGTPLGGNAHEVVSDMKVRQEGVRIKHRYGKNFCKMYDKAYDELGAVLRPELTINAPQQFRVVRPKTGDEKGPMKVRTLRAGVADLYRRADVSQKALDRYCTALAAVDDAATLGELTARLEKRVKWQGQWVRALHPFDADDLALLRAVNGGDFAIDGIRNRDLQQLLYSQPATSDVEKRRRSAAISRKLRLLRAHGLIHKVAKRNLYRVSQKARLVLNAILSAQQATTQQLTAMVA